VSSTTKDTNKIVKHASVQKPWKSTVECKNASCVNGPTDCITSLHQQRAVPPKTKAISCTCRCSAALNTTVTLDWLARCRPILWLTLNVCELVYGGLLSKEY